MIFRQLTHDDLGCASYLIGDARAGVATVVDPKWDAGHIPGSVHRPYHDIDALPDGVDPDRPVAAICGSGQRSAVGASLVKRHGVERGIHVVDRGVPHWRRAGWPIEKPARAAA